jgi:hypothetical protein
MLFERRKRSPANKVAKVPVLHRNTQLMIVRIADREREFAEFCFDTREAVQKTPAPQGFVNERKWIGFALFPASGSGEAFLYEVMRELKKRLLPGVEAVSALNLGQRRELGRSARSEQPYASGRRYCGGGSNIRELCR